MLSLLVGQNPFETITRKEIEAQTKRNKFSSFLPWLSYDPEHSLYYNSDQTIGFLLQCAPLARTNEKIEKNLAGLIELLPPEGVLTFTMISSPNIEPHLNAYRALKARARDNQLLKEAIEDQIAFLKKRNKGACPANMSCKWGKIW